MNRKTATNLRLRAAGAALALLAWGAALPAAAGVVEVRLRPSGLMPGSEFDRLREFPIPGEVSEEALERTRANILATGRFDSVVVRREPVAGGERLVFELEPQAYVRKLEFEGRHQIGRLDASSTLQLEHYSPIQPGDLDVAVEQIRETYRWFGFPAPEVTVETEQVGADAATRVVFELDEQPLPGLQELKADYGPAIGNWQRIRLKTRFWFLRRSLRKHGVNDEKIDDLLRDEERRFESLGFWNADFESTIEPPVPGPPPLVPAPDAEPLGPPDLGPRRVELQLAAGKRTRLDVEGAGFWARRSFLRDVRGRPLPLSEGRIKRLQEALAEELKSRGWLDPRVESRRTEEDEKIRVVLAAEPGPRSQVASERFEGNQRIGSGRLAGATPLHPPRLFGLWRSRPGPGKLDEAARAVASVYVGHGYPEVKVETRLAGDPPHRTVVYEIDEGPYRQIDEVGFEGASALDRKKLEELAGLKPGRPFVWGQVEKAVPEIKAAYLSRGYADVKIVPAFRYGPGSAATVVFQIEEGPGYVLGPTIVRHNFKTRAPTILKLEELPTGETFEFQPVADLQQDVHDLEIFDSVNIRTRERMTVEPPEKIVMIDVSERRTGFYELGLELNTERGLEATGAVGDRNLFGRALTVILSGLIGTERSTVTLEGAQPYIFGTRIHNRLLVSYVDDRTHDGFDLSNSILEEALTRKIGEDWRLALRYRFENVATFNVDPDVAGEIDFATGRIGSVIPEVYWDSRDEPFNTTRGWLIGSRFKSANRIFGSELNFLRLEGEARYYQPIAGETVLAAALRGGRIWAIEGERELPLSERFFVGGANTQRGFPENELGPEAGDGSPLGGESMMLANLELRFPIYKLIQGGLFVDAANNWRTTPEAPYFRPAAGLGLRIRTPVGPLRGDLGWNLDREEGEDRYVFHIALGQAF